MEKRALLALLLCGLILVFHLYVIMPNIKRPPTPEKERVSEREEQEEQEKDKAKLRKEPTQKKAELKKDDSG